MPKVTQRICRFCYQRAVENELHLLLDCPNYEEIRKDTFNFIIEIDNTNLNHGNKIKNLKHLT